MTICDVYLGDPADPRLNWDGGNWSGDTPRAPWLQSARTGLTS